MYQFFFLLLCNPFETDRKNILDLVAGEVKNFHTLSCENKLILLMNNGNISILKIFTFITERNIQYQYLIMASLILVACIGIVLVFLVQ
jgi:hypothetical protein